MPNYRKLEDWEKARAFEVIERQAGFQLYGNHPLADYRPVTGEFDAGNLLFNYTSLIIKADPDLMGQLSTKLVELVNISGLKPIGLEEDCS